MKAYTDKQIIAASRQLPKLRKRVRAMIGAEEKLYRQRQRLAALVLCAEDVDEVFKGVPISKDGWNDLCYRQVTDCGEYRYTRVWVNATTRDNPASKRLYGVRCKRSGNFSTNCLGNGWTKKEAEALSKEAACGTHPMTGKWRNNDGTVREGPVQKYI
jgi:hypothetical protein